MRFEHLIEINSPSPTLDAWVAPMSRDQLWQGLLIRVRSPQHFPMGPERCDWQLVDPENPNVIERVLQFGAHRMQDRVQLVPMEKVVFTPQAHDETTPADLMNQTAHTTNSVTFTGTMANADVVVFKCLGF